MGPRPGAPRRAARRAHPVLPGLLAAEMADWPTGSASRSSSATSARNGCGSASPEAKNLGQLNDETPSHRHDARRPADHPHRHGDRSLQAGGVGRHARSAAPRGDRRQAAALHGAGRIGLAWREPPHRRASGTSPYISAVPTPSPRRSRTCSAGSAGDREGLAPEKIGVAGGGACRRPCAAGRNDALSAVTLAESWPVSRSVPARLERPVVAIYQPQPCVSLFDRADRH